MLLAKGAHSFRTQHRFSVLTDRNIYTGDKHCLTSSLPVKEPENSSWCSCTIHPAPFQIQNRFTSLCMSKFMLYYPFVVPAADFPRCFSLTVIFSSQLLTNINCHQHSYGVISLFISHLCSCCLCPLSALSSGKEKSKQERGWSPQYIFCSGTSWHCLDVSPPTQVATVQ